MPLSTRLFHVGLGCLLLAAAVRLAALFGRSWPPTALRAASDTAMHSGAHQRLHDQAECAVPGSRLQRAATLSNEVGAELRGAELLRVAASLD